jgi:hypothetical protein
MLLLMQGIRRTRFQLPQWSYKLPAYMIGTMAMYWLIERLVAGS